MTTCYQELRRQGSKFLTHFPGLKHEWIELADGSVALHFPKSSSSGFDIYLTGKEKEVVIYSGGLHTHVDDQPDPEDCINHALGFVRDLLTKSMRLRVCFSNGKPYRWFLESKCPVGWEVDDGMGLIFWNYFGRKSEEVFQNDQLPSRSGHGKYPPA